MLYREYGETGLRVSRLGFGIMRLPAGEDGKVDFDRSTPLIRKSLQLGINIFDSHHDYHDGDSEVAIGKAIAGWDRSKIVIQTKNPYYTKSEGSNTHRARLELALEKLGTDYVDCYLSHSLKWSHIDDLADEFFTFAEKARDEGLVRHIGFSSHDKPEMVRKMIDTGRFEIMLVQYNLIDHVYAEVIRHAREKGLAVSVMGPVGGGGLSTPTEISHLVKGGDRSGAKPALRFVFDNDNIDVAFSGMSSLDQLDENVAIASNPKALSDHERDQIKRFAAKKQKLSDLYCTACGYCMPCPNGVNIPWVFSRMTLLTVYRIEDFARKSYENLVKIGVDASKCAECGECEPRCPQNIPIIEQLKECHKKLAS